MKNDELSSAYTLLLPTYNYSPSFTYIQTLDTSLSNPTAFIFFLKKKRVLTYSILEIILPLDFLYVDKFKY